MRTAKLLPHFATTAFIFASSTTTGVLCTDIQCISTVGRVQATFRNPSGNSAGCVVGRGLWRGLGPHASRPAGRAGRAIQTKRSWAETTPVSDGDDVDILRVCG